MSVLFIYQHDEYGFSLEAETKDSLFRQDDLASLPVEGQGGSYSEVREAGDGTADKPARQVSRAVKSQDERRQMSPWQRRGPDCIKDLADGPVKSQT